LAALKSAHVIDREPTKLDLLTRGDVGETFAKFAADFGDGTELRSGGDAVRHAPSHHEMARRLAPEEYAGPLELFVAVGDGLPSFAGVSRNIVEDVSSSFSFLYSSILFMT